MDRTPKAKISIITVCHKSNLTILEYVSSFLKFHSNIKNKSFCEFIFVENSGDKNIETSVSQLTESGFEVSVIYSENKGFGAGCNVGALSATGQILTFINPDIRFLSSILPLLDIGGLNRWGTVKQLARSNRISSIDLLPENKGIFFEIIKGHIWINLFNSFFLQSSYASGSFLIAGKDLFFKAGCFNEEFFMYYEEAELCRRLYKISGKLFIEKKVIISHEGFGSQSSHEEILRNEAKGLITYCKITNQRELAYKKLKIYKILGIWSKFSKLKSKQLQNVISKV